MAENRETEIYGGRAKVVFNAAAHTYKVVVGDAVYRHPSVTTVLKVLNKGDALINWAANQTADRILFLGMQMGPDVSLDATGLAGLVGMARETWRETREDAATIGSHVHDILAHELLGEKWEYPTFGDHEKWMLGSVKNAVGAGLKFFKEHSIQIIEVEKPRWSPVHGFIGTGDLIACIDGRLAVLDFKTGKGASYPEYYAQTAAYAIAYEEEHPGQHIESRWVVRVGKTGVLAHSERREPEHAIDRDAFLYTLKLWEWQNKLQSRTSFTGPAPAM